jgi:RimJ/RimL family protein N-acetyltransferase
VTSVNEDWRRAFEYESDPLYLRYYEWTERTPESCAGVYRLVFGSSTAGSSLQVSTGDYVEIKQSVDGSCGVRMDKVDAVEADIGYELDPQHWNLGYATEAAHTIVDFGFSRFGVHRIWAHCVADNLGSAHVLEKLGMKLEGRLREKEFYKGRWWDTLMYAILAEEWEAHRQVHPVNWKEIKD